MKSIIFGVVVPVLCGVAAGLAVGALVLILAGCGGGAHVEPPAEQANQACIGHRGVAQIVKEPYSPESGGGRIESVVCRDGVVK